MNLKTAVQHFQVQTIKIQKNLLTCTGTGDRACVGERCIGISLPVLSQIGGTIAHMTIRLRGVCFSGVTE